MAIPPYHEMTHSLLKGHANESLKAKAIGDKTRDNVSRTFNFFVRKPTGDMSQSTRSLPATEPKAAMPSKISNDPQLHTGREIININWGTELLVRKENSDESTHKKTSKSGRKQRLIGPLANVGSCNSHVSVTRSTWDNLGRQLQALDKSNCIHSKKQDETLYGLLSEAVLCCDATSSAESYSIIFEPIKIKELNDKLINDQSYYGADRVNQLNANGTLKEILRLSGIGIA